MEPTVEEVEMKQAMARASQYVVLAVDSTKLSQRSAVRALSLDQIQTVVTELISLTEAGPLPGPGSAALTN